jgi:hypothetical protein
VPRRLAPGAAPTSCDSEVGTQTIIEPAELKSAARVQIVFEAVACHRLDDHPRAVRL